MSEYDGEYDVCEECGVGFDPGTEGRANTIVSEVLLCNQCGRSAAEALIKELQATLTEARRERDDEAASAALHSELNRKAAKALGKPFEGRGSSWHDIPECILALRARIKKREAERERRATTFEKLLSALDWVRPEITAKARTEPDWERVAAATEAARRVLGKVEVRRRARVTRLA